MDPKEVEKLASLARLELTDGEARSLAHDIESILGYVSEIQEVSTDESKPVVGDPHNVSREDGEPHESGIFTEEMLAQAPARKDDFLKVKKILHND